MLGSVLAGWCATASAQTFYKWTDDGGTVHFSDSAPPNVRGVEERNLPNPPAQGRAAEPSAEPHDGGNADSPKESKGGGGDGPARVILVARQAPRIGPSALHIIGKVKNVGGADAQGVSVSISAVDSTQGTPCLQESAPVNPSTLGPGATGNFDVNLDSPCLYGDPNVDVAPVWE